MTSPIDTVSVAVEPDFAAFESTVDRQIGAVAREMEAILSRALDNIARDANASADDIARYFEAGGEQVEDSLREIGSEGEQQFDRLEREARDAGNSVGRQLDGMSRGLGGIGRGALLAGGGLAAAFAGGLFIADSVREADRLGDALAVTEQIIRQTEGAAGLLAAQVQDIAQSLSLEIGVDSAAVQEAANVLLTFRNVSEETFGSALGLAADLSTVLGTDLNGAALQLGKALNDPIRGVSALSRAGVQFTEAQREQIASLVESNDLLGAQQIILSEIESQVGGTAAQTADSWAIVANTFRELQRELGAALIPAIDAIAPHLVGLFESLGPLFGSLGEILGGLGQQLIPIIDVIGSALGEGLEALLPAVEPLGDALLSIVEALAPLLPVVGRLIGTLLPPLARIIAQLADALAPVIQLIADLVDDALAMLEPHLPVLVDLFGQVAAVMAQNLMRTLPIVVDLLLTLLAALLPLIPPLVEITEALLPFLSNVDLSVAILTALAEVIEFAVVPFLELLTNLLEGDVIGALEETGGTFGVMRDVIFATVGAIRSFIESSVARIRATLDGIRAVVGRVRGFFNDMRAAIVDRVGAVVAFVRGVPQRILGALGSTGRLLYQAGRNVIQGLIDGIRSMIGNVAGVVGDVAQTVRDFLPFSPAKVGPLSGSGSPDRAGEMIARMIAEGIASENLAAARATHNLMSAVRGAVDTDGSGRGIGSVISAPAASLAPAAVDVRVFIGERELTDIVDVRITERNRGTQRRVAAGSGSAR